MLLVEKRRLMKVLQSCFEFCRIHISPLQNMLLLSQAVCGPQVGDWLRATASGQLQIWRASACSCVEVREREWMWYTTKHILVVGYSVTFSTVYSVTVVHLLIWFASNRHCSTINSFFYRVINMTWWTATYSYFLKVNHNIMCTSLSSISGISLVHVMSLLGILLC